MLSKDDNNIKEAIVKSLLPKVKDMNVEQIKETIDNMEHVPQEFKLAILNEILVIRESEEEEK